MSRSEPRCVTPLDLPLVRRTLAYRLPLDISAELTRGSSGMEDALLSTVPLTDLGAPTLVLRNGESGCVGQFRLRNHDKTVAYLTFVAPEPQDGDSHEWTRLLEAITFEAGKRGAHVVKAEVPDNHAAFIAFRMAGFAVFARQVVLRREPGEVTGGDASLLRPAIDRDSIAISALYANTVPRLLQQADPPPQPGTGGLVYESEGQIAGYLAIDEGKSGIIVKPYFHPGVYDQASAIILSALTHIPRAGQVPVYLYARAYQDWLRGALEQVEFVPWTHQTLMVKYTLVRTGRIETAPLPALETNRLRTTITDGPMPMRENSLWRRHPWLRLPKTWVSRVPLSRRNGR